MKILITGGAGFIGSEFVRQAVRRGHEVLVFDKLTYAGDLRRLEEVQGDIVFYQGSVTDRDLLDRVFKEFSPQVVVHFAAESHVDRSILEPDEFLRTNVLGTQVLLDTSRKYGIERFVNISTDEVYGELGPEGSFREEDPLKPNSPYSVSKAAQDMLGRAYWRTYSLPIITVRPCNNYGPWQYPEKLIPVVVYKALNNEPVPVYGSGENVREWLYVSDCAEGIFAVLERGQPGEIYNLGSSFERKNIEVVRAILSILGRSEDLIEFVKDRPGHDFRYSLNTEKTRREINWSAKTVFEEGIEKTVQWYLQHRQWLEEKVSELKDLWQRVYSK
ncbi:MAG: dTDP-glucose 4,6-dehydratase [Nitrospirae bacterium]|nr:MAG: dTDP-glucose 4,6-dehydratase [Nitrospirota bacterium]